MIIQFCDCTCQNIKFIAFLCLKSVTIRARWAGALSSWKIKLILVCPCIFCAFMLPSTTHVVTTLYHVMHVQFIRLTLTGGPGHPIFAGSFPHIHMITFSYHDLTFVSKYHSFPFSFNSHVSFLCQWYTFLRLSSRIRIFFLTTLLW